jgi:predicted AAA+ superfamily ATPase
MKIIDRKLYLKKIEPFIGKPIIKILTGMRRVGKSELLKQIRDKISKSSQKKTIYINKELREFDHISTNLDLNKYIDDMGGEAGSVILIDEIQEIKDWERSITSFLAEGMDIYLTGSNAHLLSSDLATLLSGRYVEFQIYTLSFREFIELGEFEHLSNEEVLRKYIKFGGLPGLFHLDFHPAATFQFLDAIYQTILLKDVVSRHRIRNVDLLDNIAKFIFDNIGNIFNASSIVKYLKNQQIKNSVPTIQTHVRYLTDIFIAHRIRQFDLKGKEYLDTNAKYFIGDLGLRHAILGYKESDIAGILENIVYLELCRNDYNVSLGKLDKKEIDFIAEKNGEIHYIQVAYLMPDIKTADREFSVLESIKDNHPKYVMSMDPLLIKRKSGVKHINLFNFLLNGL